MLLNAEVRSIATQSKADRATVVWPTPSELTLPSDLQTPGFIVIEEDVERNLEAVIASCGSESRFMPHLKTHRAPWITRRLVARGIKACKVATLAELELALACGMTEVLWAMPAINLANIARFILCANSYPKARLCALVDSNIGVDVWTAVLGKDRPGNISLRVDLDPGLGRTGIDIGEDALNLARLLHREKLFSGFHLYDGNIKDLDRKSRRISVVELSERVERLRLQLVRENITSDLVAGTSYTLDLWDPSIASFVSSGSWTYSSSQHSQELPELGWSPAAFVATTVVSIHEGTVTLDAGAKSISPDKPMNERFHWNGSIKLMNEEHTVVSSSGNLKPGDKLLLVPRHACTTAYLYDRAAVLSKAGHWEVRPQLGSMRGEDFWERHAR